MSINIRIRAKSIEGIAEIKALVKHPMETGFRSNPISGEKFPAHFVNEVTVLVNDIKVADAQWSGAVSANPYMALKVKANSGDVVTISVIDNKGETGQESYTIK